MNICEIGGAEWRKAFAEMLRDASKLQYSEEFLRSFNERWDRAFTLADRHRPTSPE